MQIVAVDMVGPLPQSTNGNLYLLVAEDYFTKWLEVWAIPNQEAKTIAEKLLNKMFFRFSCLISFTLTRADSLRVRLLKSYVNYCRLISLIPPRIIFRGMG